jgi:hypothetical protein
VQKIFKSISIFIVTIVSEFIYLPYFFFLDNTVVTALKRFWTQVLSHSSSYSLTRVEPLIESLIKSTGESSDPRKLDLISWLQLLLSQTFVQEAAPLLNVDLEPILIYGLCNRGAPILLTRLMLRLASSWFLLFPRTTLSNPCWSALMNAACIELLLGLDSIDPNHPPLASNEDNMIPSLVASCQIFEVVLETVIQERIQLNECEQKSWQRQSSDLVLALGSFLSQVPVSSAKSGIIELDTPEAVLASPVILSLTRLLCQLLCELDDNNTTKAGQGVIPLLLDYLSTNTTISFPFITPCLARISVEPKVLNALLEHQGYRVLTSTLKNQDKTDGNLWQLPIDWDVITHISSALLNILLLNKPSQSSKRESVGIVTSKEILDDALNFVQKIESDFFNVKRPHESAHLQGLGTLLTYCALACRTHAGHLPPPPASGDLQSTHPILLLIDRIILYFACVQVDHEVMESLSDLLHLMSSAVVEIIQAVSWITIPAVKKRLPLSKITGEVNQNDLRSYDLFKVLYK